MRAEPKQRQHTHTRRVKVRQTEPRLVKRMQREEEQTKNRYYRNIQVANKKYIIYTNGAPMRSSGRVRETGERAFTLRETMSVLARVVVVVVDG